MLSRRLVRAAGLALAIVLPSLCGIALAQDAPHPVTADQKAQILAELSKTLEGRAFIPNVDFREWDGFLAKQRSAIDKAGTQREFGLAVQKALSSFGMSHIYLMTPEMVDSRVHHSIVGIGIGFAKDPKGVAVTKVFPGSAAAQAGIRAGDVILLAEGKKIDDPLSLRGELGSIVHVLVERPDGTKEKLALTRSAYSTVEPATIDWPDKSTACVTIPTFDLPYDSAKVHELMTEAAKAKNLVLDLRGNPGGAVLNMLDLLDLLLPPGSEMGTFITRREVKQYQTDHPGPVDVVKLAKLVPDSGKLRVPGRESYFKGTLAVLIDAGSGSAAEMTAAALHDVRGATIVGTKSAGAVLVSVIRPLLLGYSLQFPLADYVTIDGVRLEGHGVIPDFVAQDPRVPGRDVDEPLVKAVAIIEKLDAQRAVLGA